MLASLSLIVALAPAPQALPVCFVVGEEQIYLLTDANQDGDYRDVGESTLYADLSAPGWSFANGGG